MKMLLVAGVVMLSTACGKKDEGADKSAPGSAKPASDVVQAVQPAQPAQPVPSPTPTRSAECENARSIAESTADARVTFAKASDSATTLAVLTLTDHVKAAKGKPHEAAAQAALTAAEAAQVSAKESRTASEACHAAITSKAADAGTTCATADAASTTVLAAQKAVVESLEASKLPAKDAAELKDMAANATETWTTVGASGPVQQLVAAYAGCAP